MHGKNITNFSPQGEASNILRDGGANPSFSPVEFSKIGKFTSLGEIFY
jgi:hypothetical protein